MSKLQPNVLAKNKQQMKKPVVGLQKSIIRSERIQYGNANPEHTRPRRIRNPFGPCFYYGGGFDSTYLSHLRFTLDK